MIPQCPSCGAQRAPGARFCGWCGTGLGSVCHACGFLNPSDYRFCGQCGVELGTSCSTCGFLVPPGYRFCGRCGTGVSELCSECGAPLPVGARFCGQCGAPVGASDEVEAAATIEAPEEGVAAEPATVAGAHLSRTSLEGEFRLVSVLFAEALGAEELAEHVGDRAVSAALMNDALDLLSREIRKQDGTIDKFVGDVVMALFGAPIMHENDPERACRAALNMHAALKRYSEKLVRNYGVGLELRIGINTGQVVSGAVGSSARADYTVMGDTVNVASRLEHHSSAHRTRVSESTYVAARNFFEFEGPEQITVKGKDEPLVTYFVVGERKRRGRLRGIEGLETKMVGRDAELQAAQDAFNAALRGETTLVGISGEAGLGKSRLLFEFRKFLDAGGHLEDIAYLKGRSLPYEANAYGPVIEILRSFFRIEEEDDQAEIRLKVESSLDDRDEAPFFMRLFWAGYEDERLKYLAPEQLKRETLAAIYRILHNESQARPILVIFEDAHWIDSSSLEVLNYLLSRVEDVRMMIICLYRPDMEIPAPWTQFPHFSRIQLKALDKEQTHELIDGLLKSTDIPEQVKDLIIDKAGGNPYYVEEIIKSFIDSHVIVRENGLWRATREITDLDVPGNLQRVLLARIDRLEDGSKRALQQAAVIGRRFPVPVLRRVTDVDPLDPRLEDLEGREFIYPADLVESIDYSFKHALSQEVAYNTLLVRRRRELHARTGSAIEEFYSRTLQQHLDALVYHFTNGEIWEKALVFSKEAGIRAKELFANIEALRYFDQALAIVDRLDAQWQELEDAPEDERERLVQPAVPRDALLRLRVQLLTDRGLVHGILAQYDRALADYEQVVAIATARYEVADALWRSGEVYERKGLFDKAIEAYQRALDEVPDDEQGQVLRAKVLASAGFVYQRQGQSDKAKECGLGSLALLQDSDHYAELGHTYNLLGFLAYSGSDWNGAVDGWKRSSEYYERIRDAWQAARIYNNLAVAYFQSGDPDTATEFFHKNLEAMKKIGDVLTLSSAYLNLGGIYKHRGESDKAIDYYSMSLAMQERAGQLSGQVRSHINIGESYRDSGNLEKAIEHLEIALRIATEIGAKESLPQAYLQLSETFRRLDRHEDALQMAERCYDVSHEIGRRLEEALALRAIGRALSHLDQPVPAMTRLRAAADALAELKSDQEQGITRLELAQLLAAHNGAKEAAEQADQAVGLLEKLPTAKSFLEQARALKQDLTVGAVPPSTD
ncbi:MAG: tetratricopeptide repeat protein [Chloroflexi bacterium]|nr:tetratricopeptide repeat protein [Chloroflexota bacterium]